VANNEKTKRKELKNGTRGEPTQEAAQAKKAEKARQENLQKTAMKRQGAACKKDVDPQGETSVVESSKKAPHKKDTSTKEKPKSGKRPQQANAPQGRRKVPTAGDDCGCKHHGLRELDPCEKGWIAAYVKVGAWLYRKPCIDCAARCNDTDETRERVLDASVLLLVREPIVAYICNCGPIGHKMMERGAGGVEYQCDMMLCLPCYSERGSKMEEGAGSKRRRRQKVNSY
jgi:hypothetical protein